jgi:type IV fimbrial biogenesis protein FimT
MHYIHVHIRQMGLTLVELLVTLSIAIVILTIGVPAFTDLLAANMAASYANDLLADIHYARSEAITRGIRVVVCKGTATAVNSGCTSGNWEDGWKVFEDCNNDQHVSSTSCPDRNGNGVADNETVMRVHPPLAAGWTLRGNHNVANRITIVPDGRTSTNGTLVTCQRGVLNAGNQTRSAAVVINLTGRARVSMDNNGDGIPDDADSCYLN